MPNPTPSDVHVDSLLTNLSIGYQQSAVDFVGDQVFPVVPVAKQSDRYLSYERGDFFRDEMKVRAPSTESAGGGWRVDNTNSYSADVWALHKDIDDQLRANVDVGDLQQDATIYLTQQGLIRKDKLWVANYFTTSLWTGDQTGVVGVPAANQFTQFDSATASDPFKTIRAQITEIKRRTGYKPNTLVMGMQVWSVLADHSQMLDRIKYTQTGIVDTSLLAASLGLDRVLVASGVENTALEGAANTFAFVAGKNMLLVYAAPNPGLFQPSGGYTFAWNGLLGASANGTRMLNWRADLIHSDRVEVEMAFDHKLVAADLGVFFSGAVS